MKQFLAQLLKAAGHAPGRVSRVAPAANGAPGILVRDPRIQTVERALWRPIWTFEKFDSDAARLAGAKPFELAVVPGNILLNEGIAEMWDLVIGAAASAFNNANSYIGVGDSTTATAAGQTGLQAATNKAYVGMEAGYPSRAAQTVSFRSVFDSATGNFAWQEMTVANGNSDAADNMNRLVSNQGTKANGQSWTVTLDVSLS